MRVLGMISRAFATALYGHWMTPATLFDFSSNANDRAISAAPPPGTRTGSIRTLRATCMASCKLRSTSFKMSLLAPRRRMQFFFDVLRSHLKDLTSQHNNRCCSITDFFVLRTTDLNHTFGSGMLDLNFPENGVSIIRHDNSAHGVHQHLEHGF